MMSNQNEIPTLRSSSKGKIFKSVGHADKVSKKLQTFYENKEFFDIVLVSGVDNSKVSAHRIVLNAMSDYFATMSRSNLQEASAAEVPLSEIDGVTLRLVVDFMYTATVELYSEIVESLLSAADFLQIDTLIKACCDFMEEELDASNCLGIALLAEQYSYTALHKKAFIFACMNFEKLCTEKEFLQLNEEQFIKLISSDDLLARSEEVVFQSLVKWVEHDKENRESLVFNLLSHIRFTMLGPKFIIENRHSVCNSMECYALIGNWFEWHLAPESRSRFQAANTKPRKPKKKLAFATGESINSLKVKTLNRELNIWSYEELPISSRFRFSYTIIVIDNKMIVDSGNTLANSLDCLDLKTKQWTYLPPMLTRRDFPAMAELNGDLYVIGGRSHLDWSRSVEKYSFFTQKWQEVAPLNSILANIKVSSEDNALYAVGSATIAIESYNITANKWTQIRNRNEDLINFGIAVVGGQLYAVGGHKDGSLSKAIERFNPITDTWSYVSPLKVEWILLRCISVNKRLIVCGGTDNGGWVGFVEEYNPDTNEWITLDPVDPAQVDVFKSASSLFTM